MQKFLASLGKHKLVMGAFLAVGVLLIIIGGASSLGGETQAGDARGDYERELEKRLTALCLSVEGIDEATVLVTADDELAGGASRYYSAQTALPKVRGVAAVVTRGGDADVRRTLIELISASLGIPTSRVSVAPCK